MGYKRYYNPPRMIFAHFNCVCAETGKRIKKGDACLYFPKTKEVVCEDSKTSYEWRCNEEDLKLI